MEFTKLTEIEVPAAFDAHVHLRDGEMSQLVTPTIRKGGVNQVYVMVSEHCPLDSCVSSWWYTIVFPALSHISVSIV
jgi:dihydroorotase